MNNKVNQFYYSANCFFDVIYKTYLCVFITQINYAGYKSCGRRRHFRVL